MKQLSEELRGYFDVSIDQSDQIASLFKRETIQKQEFHTQMGNRFGKLSFVKDGFLRIYRQTDQKEVTQWISSPGEFTTELGCLFFDQPARWHIQAITDCTLYTLDQASYKELNHLVANWAEIEKRFLAKCFMTVEDRVFSFLSMNSEERYQYLESIKPTLFQSVPQQYIASMLGMTPETFSRIRGRFIS